MNAQPLTARVSLWGRLVGAIAEIDGRRLFEYAPDYLVAGGPSISPVHLPAERGVFQFPELMRVDAFKGLPGAFADSPPRFGDRLQKLYFARHGVAPRGGQSGGVGKAQGTRNAAAVIERVEHAATGWPRFADAAELSATWQKRVGDDLLIGA